MKDTRLHFYFENTERPALHNRIIKPYSLGGIFSNEVFDDLHQAVGIFRVGINGEKSMLLSFKFNIFNLLSKIFKCLCIILSSVFEQIASPNNN